MDDCLSCEKTECLGHPSNESELPPELLAFLSSAMSDESLEGAMVGGVIILNGVSIGGEDVLQGDLDGLFSHPLIYTGLNIEVLQEQISRLERELQIAEGLAHAVQIELQAGLDGNPKNGDLKKVIEAVIKKL